MLKQFEQCDLALKSYYTVQLGEQIKSLIGTKTWKVAAGSEMCRHSIVAQAAHEFSKLVEGILEDQRKTNQTGIVQSHCRKHRFIIAGTKGNE